MVRIAAGRTETSGKERANRLTSRGSHSRIMLAPSLEPESLAQQSRCDVARDQRRLDRQGARAAHRIKKSTAVSCNRQPPRTHQDAGGEIFLQWRGDPAHPISTLMQAFAGEIDAHGHVAALSVHMDAQIRVIGTRCERAVMPE